MPKMTLVKVLSLFSIFFFFAMMLRIGCDCKDTKKGSAATGTAFSFHCRDAMLASHWLGDAFNASLRGLILTAFLGYQIGATHAEQHGDAAAQGTILVVFQTMVEANHGAVIAFPE